MMNLIPEDTLRLQAVRLVPDQYGKDTEFVLRETLDQLLRGATMEAMRKKAKVVLHHNDTVLPGPSVHAVRVDLFVFTPDELMDLLRKTYNKGYAHMGPIHLFRD